MWKVSPRWKQAIPSSDISECSLTGDIYGNLARFTKRRYAEFWQNTVLMDWFRLYVYMSSDSAAIRDLDLVAEAPELAEHIAQLTGAQFQPQDVLAGIGPAMMLTTGHSDPDIWAAIDIGHIVCRFHYDERAFEVSTWEARTSLLAGAAIAGFVTNTAMRGALYARPEDGGGEVVPKIYRLVDYLVMIAAQEKYMDLEAVKRGDKLTRFRRDDQLFLSLLTRAADVALTMSSDWGSGPVNTAAIAERGHQLMMEVVQTILPTPLLAPIDVSLQPACAPRQMGL